MFGFLKKIFSSDHTPAAAEAAATVEYQGFSIQPCPREEAGGWSTEAIITKEVGGETRTHHFIRADKTGSRDGAIELTLNKCRMTIDQIGERIFS